MTGAEFAMWGSLLLLGFVLSAMYSGLETGLYSLNSIRLTVRSARGAGRARRLRREASRLDRVLAVLLIGNNAANYLGSFALATIMAGMGLADSAVIVLQALIIAPLLFVLGETLPKELFLTHSDRLTYRLSAFITASRWLFTATLLLPIVGLFARVMGRALGSHETMRISPRGRVSQLMKEGVGAGVLTVWQTTIADRALTIRSRSVVEVMAPWSDVVRLPEHAHQGDRAALLSRQTFSRLPVVNPTGEVTGIVHWADALLETDKLAHEIQREVMTLRSDVRLLDAMSRLRNAHQPMAIVVSAHDGKPIGLVTLKDLVEPLTGELGAW
jgi:putative hemolysin